MIIIDKLTYTFGREGMMIWRDGDENIFIKMDALEKLALAQNAASGAVADLGEISREAAVKSSRTDRWTWLGDIDA